MRTGKFAAMDETEFKTLISTSKSRSEIFRKLNMLKTGGAFTLLNRRIKELQIDASHFDDFDKTQRAREVNKIPLDKILVENSTYHANDLKKRLIKNGMLKNICAICSNNGQWLNQKLVLQLDHINGIRNDNRFENLRLLCPNCHSQTKTWGQKKRN